MIDITIKPMKTGMATNLLPLKISRSVTTIPVAAIKIRKKTNATRRGEEFFAMRTICQQARAAQTAKTQNVYETE